MEKSQDKKIAEKLADKYLLKPNLHWWRHKQSGKFILTHDAVQIIAESEDITFDEPKGNWDELPNVTLLVVGRMGAKIEWSFGECNPKNSFNPYPWAMAEKRAKDRVTLKLIGAYKFGISSEIEAEDFSVKDKTFQPKDDGSGLPIEAPKPPQKPIIINKVEEDKGKDEEDAIALETIKDLDDSFKEKIKTDYPRNNNKILERESFLQLEKTKFWFNKIGAVDDFNSILMLATGGITDIKEVSKSFPVDEILKPLRDAYRKKTEA